VPAAALTASSSLQNPQISCLPHHLQQFLLAIGFPFLSASPAFSFAVGSKPIDEPLFSKVRIDTNTLPALRIVGHIHLTTSRLYVASIEPARELSLIVSFFYSLLILLCNSICSLLDIIKRLLYLLSVLTKFL
jgi:hypothetical protein